MLSFYPKVSDFKEMTSVEWIVNIERYKRVSLSDMGRQLYKDKHPITALMTNNGGGRSPPFFVVNARYHRVGARFNMVMLK